MLIKVLDVTIVPNIINVTSCSRGSAWWLDHLAGLPVNLNLNICK
jgi:hypothetical protein